jgi:hypothetical protein
MVTRPAAAGFLLLVASCATGQVLLKGSVTSRDSGQFRMLPFEVPAGTKRLDVQLTFTGRDQGTQLYLGIFDPIMYRGAGRLSFTISEYDATPPFAPGPIVPGTWHLALGVVNVNPEGTSDYTARIDFSTSDDRPAGIVLRSEPGWYKGDLHSHTGHSDGVCLSQAGKNVPCPAFKLVEAAAARHLNFLAITDHNTAVTLNSIREMQPYFDRLLLIHGREMTTFAGHANVWGTAEFLDFRIGYRNWTIDDFLDQVHRAHALVSINHAYWPVGPACPGCGWGWKEQTDFSRIDAIEIVNGYSEKGSWFQPPAGNGVPFWEEQIAQGHRITGVGGSDDHRAGEQLDRASGVGNPTTVVYARELSEPAILEGIKAGHVFVQLRGPEGPALYLSSGQAIMGDNIHVADGTAVEFQLRATDCSGGMAAVILDGRPAKTYAIDGNDRTGTVSLTLGGGRHWVRATLQDAAGSLVALTNPIYVNY